MFLAGNGQFFDGLFRLRFPAKEIIPTETVCSFEYKWLRAVAHNEYTGLHSDRVFMGSKTPNLLTCWIPIGDIPKQQGTLVVLSGSNKKKRV